jgi:hypothetical protein
VRVRLFLAAAITITTALAGAPTVFARAIVHSIKATSDLTDTVLACPNENVVFSGVATITETDVTTPSGERIGTFLFQLSDVTAVGQTSGRKFRVVGVTATGFSFPIGTLHDADTSRFVQTWLLVPIDGGAPLSFHEILILVFDANGDLAALVSQGPSDCN